MVDDRTGPEPELRSLRPDEWDSGAFLRPIVDAINAVAG